MSRDLQSSTLQFSPIYSSRLLNSPTPSPLSTLLTSATFRIPQPPPSICVDSTPPQLPLPQNRPALSCLHAIFNKSSRSKMTKRGRPRAQASQEAEKRLRSDIDDAVDENCGLE
ncbi:uncharacterized protein LOC121741128 [Salvia splendens]|uniref:uncharacterized protein LOC121741128 n=1 Tax=Salvia splendens TaxID=180675 RepID=UPI001C25CE39|nr:uncharacterized protein LOC121741128 [Salvia splendens]